MRIKIVLLPQKQIKLYLMKQQWVRSEYRCIYITVDSFMHILVYCFFLKLVVVIHETMRFSRILIFTVWRRVWWRPPGCQSPIWSTPRMWTSLETLKFSTLSLMPKMRNSSRSSTQVPSRSAGRRRWLTQECLMSWTAINRMTLTLHWHPGRAAFCKHFYLMNKCS